MQPPPAFPLYDDLCREAQSEKGAVIDAQQVCLTINGMNQEHARIIYMLLVHHFILSGGSLNPNRPVPYEADTFEGGRGLSQIMMKLPTLLQQIIARYVKRAGSLQACS